MYMEEKPSSEEFRCCWLPSTGGEGGTASAFSAAWRATMKNGQKTRAAIVVYYYYYYYSSYHYYYSRRSGWI